MKERIFVSFNVGRALRSTLIPLLKKLSCLDGLARPDSFLAGSFGYWFQKGDERMTILRDELQKREISWRERIEYSYEPEDLCNAWMLRVTLRTAEKESASLNSKQFDLAARGGSLFLGVTGVHAAAGARGRSRSAKTIARC